MGTKNARVILTAISITRKPPKSISDLVEDDDLFIWGFAPFNHIFMAEMKTHIKEYKIIEKIYLLFFEYTNRKSNFILL